MKVAVLGRSSFNGLLSEHLVKEGLEPVFLEEINEIKNISGETGKFLIKTIKDVIEVGYVIVAQEPQTFDKPNNALENGRSAVILLDYPEESPAYMTEAALHKAVSLARKQKKVVLLSRFMRIAGRGLEELYKEARNLGVVFIRYNQIAINRNDDTGVYNINFIDEYDEIGLQTGLLIKMAGPSGDNIADKLAKLLKLKLDKGLHLSGESYFLSPSATSREGIYFLNGAVTGSLGEEIMQQIRFTVMAISAGVGEKTEYAEVDPGKCAFCYTCYRACPHSAMVPDYENSAMKNLNKACQTCGICVSVCPADAVEIKGRASGAEAVSGSLRVYSCENSGEIALRRITDELGDIFENINVTSVSCGGEITAEKLVDALKSYEKVLCVTCMENACKHYEGNKRARLQVVRAQEMLRAAGLSEDRIMYMQVSHAMPNVLRDKIKSSID